MSVTERESDLLAATAGRITGNEARLRDLLSRPMTTGGQEGA